MISLYELIQTDEPLSKYYQLMQDKLTDFLENVVIDITTSTPPHVRWIVMNDDYENFNSIISDMVSQLLASCDDVDKLN